MACLWWKLRELKKAFCAVATGLRSRMCAAHPALKRWANILCASGALGMRVEEGVRFRSI